MKPSSEPASRAVYSSAQARALDRIAVERCGIAGLTLMTRAGEAAYAALVQHWPGAESVLVLCGSGNNAGDGYLVARRALAKGKDVRVVAVADPMRLQGDAARARSQCVAAAVPILPWSQIEQLEFTPDVIVDALLGTGLTRDVEGDFAAAIEWINRSPAPVLALDVPSGLDADTGHPRGAAVHADVTMSFVGLKQGLYLGSAPDFCGEIALAGLGVPAEALAAIEPVMARLTARDIADALPRRARTAHKGAHGRVLIVGGGPGMGGAARLAAEAALRAGAGLVYVGTDASNVGTVMAGRPEIMCHAVAAPADLDGLLALADGVVLGPGLGTTPWAEALWGRLVASAHPLVLDADGLNLLARSPRPRAHWILTPHPGEAARLLGRSAADVERDRVLAARTLVERFGAVAVLKGARSLVAQAIGNDRISIAVCDRGNPGMATAGVGDVLAGVLGALLVQCRGDPARAARAGVLLHAQAGDDAAEDGERGTVASDLLPHIRRRANPM